MTKLKITEPGWAGYTGRLGNVEFIDGISEDHVSVREAQHLASIVQMEDADTGKNPSLSQHLIDSRKAGWDIPAPESAPVEVKVPVIDPNAAGDTEPDTAKKTALIVKPGDTYTREQLELVADSYGIKGLREIAEPMGLKAAGILDLIQKILLAQSAKGADTPEPASDEPPAAPAVDAPTGDAAGDDIVDTAEQTEIKTDTPSFL